MVTVPGAMLAVPALKACLDSRGDFHVPAEIPALEADGGADLRQRAAFTPVPPASSRLPVSYRSIPGPIRHAIAGLLGRWKRSRADRWAHFPSWPLDLSADFLQDLTSGGAGLKRPTPVVLTHDLDSPEGMRNLVAEFLPIEEAHGARSTNFVVPCGWSLDEGLLRDVRGRGHPLGIHGFDHSNRTPFAGPEERRRRLEAARPLAERFGMTGYRAPSLLRTRELIEDVARWYEYDSSIPTSGGLFPVPNNGCASARPFRFDRLVELPVSLPRDGILKFLGVGPGEVFELWKECAEVISRSGGVVVLLTHCERAFSGHPRRLEAYRRFVEWIAGDDRFAWTTAPDVVAGERRE